MTKQDLVAMWVNLKKQGVLPYSDGNYALVIPAKVFIDIEKEVGYVNITHPLNPPKYPFVKDSKTRYQGIVLGFHVWTTEE